MARSKAIEAERELDRIYREIGEITRKLKGKKRSKALEIEGLIYLGKLTPQEAIKELRRLART